jgi:hypothetical protein
MLDLIEPGQVGYLEGSKQHIQGSWFNVCNFSVYDSPGTAFSALYLLVLSYGYNVPGTAITSPFLNGVEMGVTFLSQRSQSRKIMRAFKVLSTSNHVHVD